MTNCYRIFVAECVRLFLIFNVFFIYFPNRNRNAEKLVEQFSVKYISAVKRFLSHSVFVIAEKLSTNVS